MDGRLACVLHEIVSIKVSPQPMELDRHGIVSEVEGNGGVEAAVLQEPVRLALDLVVELWRVEIRQ